MDWLHFATIPLFTGVVGWLINWTGLVMLFSPVRFHGVRCPGMRAARRACCRARSRRCPGLLQGGIGWQGIVPARAAKMGSIAVDKAIAKLGTPAEFYQQLEPDQIAEHIVDGLRAGDARRWSTTIMRREHPRLWRDLPPRGARGRGRRGSRPSCPGVVRTVTDEIGEHIDQLLDPKIMVIDHFQREPGAGGPDLPRLRPAGART